MCITKKSEVPKGVPFSLTCTNCDAEGPATFEAAVLEGWVGIVADLEGWSWNFLGYCPDHAGEYESYEDFAARMKQQKKPKWKSANR